jgi:hypothetical protein
MSTHEKASLFERLKSGLEASISHSRGELTLKTTELPAPPSPASRAKVIVLRKIAGQTPEAPMNSSLK